MKQFMLKLCGMEIKQLKKEQERILEENSNITPSDALKQAHQNLNIKCKLDIKWD